MNGPDGYYEVSFQKGTNCIYLNLLNLNTEKESRYSMTVEEAKDLLEDLKDEIEKENRDGKFLN